MRTVFSGHQEELEKEGNVRPLSPLAPELRALADGLWSNGERLPLVIESQRRGTFHCSAALWVGKIETIPVGTLAELRAPAESWEGEYPDVERWLAAVADAEKVAQQEVQRLEQQAARRECEALERQVSAARVRLQLELGRYLATLGGGTDELNVLFHRQMIRDRASGQRMQECFKRFGDYPEWPSSLCHELAEFADQLTEGQKRARQAFKELDAALQDPRWEAVKALAALA